MEVSALTIDVEDWFHILDSDSAPDLEQWGTLESRIETNLRSMLEMLALSSVKATFFWLGWIAERHTELVHECQQAGHEIASHGYAHILPYKAGPEAFREDIHLAKAVLEDIVGQRVLGFRSPGFGITKEVPWAFEIIKEAGYEYDSSSFPAARGHGGIPGSMLEPHYIDTSVGSLFEIPISVVDVLGCRTSLFGGGYLRLAPLKLIKWGMRKLEATRRPAVIYVHPREIDLDHPHLPLSLGRRFKCYVGLQSTLPKLEWLCRNYAFCTMREMASSYMTSASVPRR